MMQTTTRLVVLAIFTVTPLLSYGDPGKSYMYCRGGGEIKAVYTVTTPYPVRAQGALPGDSPWTRNLTISFTKAPKSAVAQVPPRGHCTLAGRPIHDDEPDILRGQWTEGSPTVRRKSHPGQYIYKLLITPRQTKVTQVVGDDLRFLIDGVQDPFKVFSVAIKKEQAQWKYKSIGKVFNIDQWPPDEVLPDLALKKIEQVTRDPKVGERIYFNVKVKNIGASLALSYLVRLRIGSGRVLAEAQGDRLGPDKENTHQLFLPPREYAQRYRLIARVKPGPQVKEATGANNQRAYEFSVKP
ncbi:MAG: CARDB domain-containing protein [Planctomycetota bacterium]|jgi:hypothetical protein